MQYFNFYASIMEGISYDHTKGKIVERKKDSEIIEWLRNKKISYEVKNSGKLYEIEIFSDKIKFSKKELDFLASILIIKAKYIEIRNLDVDKFENIIPEECKGIEFINSKITTAFNKIKKINELLFTKTVVDFSLIKSDFIKEIKDISIENCEIKQININGLNPKVRFMVTNGNLSDIVNKLPEKIESLFLDEVVIDGLKNLPAMNSFTIANCSIESLKGIDKSKFNELSYIQLIYKIITENPKIVTDEILLSLKEIDYELLSKEYLDIRFNVIYPLYLFIKLLNNIDVEFTIETFHKKKDTLSLFLLKAIEKLNLY